MGVPAKLKALICALHSCTWFQADGAATFGITASGGRQGCKLGADIFNSCYALALYELISAPEAEGITTKISAPSSPFWSNGNGTATNIHAQILEIAFVDDLGIVLFATSPRVLFKALDFLLASLSSIFKNHLMTINFAKGKRRLPWSFEARDPLKLGIPSGKMMVPTATPYQTYVLTLDGSPLSMSTSTLVDRYNPIFRTCTMCGLAPTPLPRHTYHLPRKCSALAHDTHSGENISKKSPRLSTLSQCSRACVASP